MKIKKSVCVLLCLAMLLCLLPSLSASRAFDGITFLVINNVLSRPMSADTMPVFIGKEVYIPYTALSTLTTVQYRYDLSQELLCFYDSNGYLAFDLANRRTYDEQGNEYEFSAQYINNTVYIPVNTTCEKFGLYHSVSMLSMLAPMVRIHEGELVASDLDFTSKLYSLLSTTYEYFIIHADLPLSYETYSPKKRAAYMAFYGDPSLYGSNILEVLQSSKAIFFLTSEEISQCGAFVRHANAKGHSVGIMLDSQSARSLSQQYTDANNALRLNCSLVSRTVSIKGGSQTLSDEQKAELLELGVRVWDFSADAQILDDDAMSSYASQGKAVVFAYDCNENTAQRLQKLLSTTSYSINPVYEWTSPVNRSGLK